MAFLLDTSTVIDWARGNENTRIILRMRWANEICISEITRYELLYGLLSATQIRKTTQRAVESLIQEILVLPFGSLESEVAAKTRVLLDKAGTPIGAYDLLIGATALASDLVMVTANEREFRRIPGLAVENWRHTTD